MPIPRDKGVGCVQRANAFGCLQMPVFHSIVGLSVLQFARALLLCACWLVVSPTMSAALADEFLGLSSGELQRHVYVIRGAGELAYWPRVDHLKKLLECQGYQVSDFKSSEAREMADLVKCRAQRQEQLGPIVFLGYSSGADSACRVACKVQKQGIRIQHLILIESTLGVPVPGNVDHCLNLYKSDPALDWIPALRGVPICRESPETELLNLDVRHDPSWKWLKKTHHLTMPSGDRLHSVLVDLVNQIHASSAP